ncbi:ATPase domain-containing protein [Methanonatronarchaeum sp. AMET-Sl]|uniref:ATPase domain-containing protein n=1 Tax=Methanonatronarchaeum sp. AMET-Sl TaxID=3037654 RepID=UPI00244DF386|nr:ATPase domain-containing protein [Methanonatronarchaeum sp. AMET-Sl]WGI16659.1 ATPase domain-containing protein [Methanonatronarchaeum sp. AMET-Sl]
MAEEDSEFGGFDLGEEEIKTDSQSERVPTGIKGFDELCGGGLLKERSYLVAGNAGSGKSTFAIQYLYNGVTKYDEPGILVVTEEDPKNIRKNMKSFNMDLKELEDQNKLAILDSQSTKIGLPTDEEYVEVNPFDMDSTLKKIVEIKEKIGAKRCVFDSTTSLGFISESQKQLRINFLKLSGTLSAIGLTSMLTAEVTDKEKMSRFDMEEFVTEGTIRLYYERKEGIRTRSIEIYKMRGSDHSKKLNPFEISSSGIEVHPKEEVYF